MALKHEETVASNMALAPLRVPRPREVRLCFCFGRHQVIFHELNLLRAKFGLCANWSTWFCYALLKLFNASSALPIGILYFEAVPIS